MTSYPHRYSCVCSHSRRAVFICDCQPRPRAQNFSTTSVSNRMVAEIYLPPAGRSRLRRYSAMAASNSSRVTGRSSSSTPSHTKSPPGGGFFIASRMALRVKWGVFLDPLMVATHCSNEYSSASRAHRYRRLGSNQSPSPSLRGRRRMASSEAISRDGDCFRPRASMRPAQ